MWVVIGQLEPIQAVFRNFRFPLESGLLIQPYPRERPFCPVPEDFLDLGAQRELKRTHVLPKGSNTKGEPVKVM